MYKKNKLNLSSSVKFIGPTRNGTTEERVRDDGDNVGAAVGVGPGTGNQ